MLLICFEFGLSISIWFYFGLDMAWVLGYDLDMVFDMTLIWFGNGAACPGLLMGWLGNRKQKQPRGQAFGRFLARFEWSWYEFDMGLI